MYLRSEAGTVLPANYAAYCASKGAVDTLTRTLACEWAKHNVLVNAVAPTIVETTFNNDPESLLTRLMPNI